METAMPDGGSPVDASGTAPSQNRQLYRCPACGEMFDERDRAEMHRHHDHVLHSSTSAAWWTQTTRTAADRQTAPARQGERRAPSSSSVDDSTTARRLQRYGHA